MTSENAWIALGAWFVLVLLYGLLRVRGEAAADPIRPSGPLDQL